MEEHGVVSSTGFDMSHGVVEDKTWTFVDSCLISYHWFVQVRQQAAANRLGLLALHGIFWSFKFWSFGSEIITVTPQWLVAVHFSLFFHLLFGRFAIFEPIHLPAPLHSRRNSTFSRRSPAFKCKRYVLERWMAEGVWWCLSVGREALQWVFQMFQVFVRRSIKNLKFCISCVLFDAGSNDASFG